MYSLRKPEKSDISWIVEASQDPYIQRRTTFGGAPTVEQATTLIEGTDGNHTTWVIQNNLEEPVGVVSIHSVDLLTGAAEVGGWVVPWARRQGAARTALSLVEKQAKQIPGVTHITLNIMEENEPSRSLAVNMTYVQESTGTCECGSQGEVDALVFKKNL